MLANEGRTTINMAELSLWISKLPPKDPNIIPQPTGPITNTSVRRKTAEQVLRTLYEQLGLNEGDFINSDLDAIADYAARSPDAYNQKYGDKPGASLFIALGGPNYVEGLARKNDIGPTFIQALTPISQAWCRRSVNKAGNQALLIDATLSDSTSTTAGRAAVENNIKSLHLKMLGAPADADDVADLLGLFQEIEPEGSATAWAAVCSVLIRDPLWILY